MADFRAVATGSFSTLANWEYSTDGGATWVAAIALPASGDDVYANGYTITFDTDVEASLFSNAALTNVAAGGGFAFGAGTMAIGDFTNGHATTCIVNDTGVGKVITGNITADLGRGLTGNATVTIIGDVTGGNAYHAKGIDAVPDVIITGTAYSGTVLNTSQRTCHALYYCVNIQVGKAICLNNVPIMSHCSGNVETVEKSSALHGDNTFDVCPNVTVSTIYNTIDSNDLLNNSASLTDASPSVTLTVPTVSGDIQVSYLAGSANYPSESDVKDGVIYGNADQFTGTLQLVDPAQLAVGLAEEIRKSGEPEWVRVRNCQTPEINQQQLTATLGG